MSEIIIIVIVLALLNVIFSSATFKGKRGEKIVEKYLKKLNEEEYKVINDLMVNTENGTSQIDHIVVSVYGVFVIETKNYQGWIIGKEYDDYWQQVIYKKKSKFRNPIKQNYGHIKALEEKLSIHKDINYISIVGFTSNATLKVNTKSTVIHTRDLVREIKKYNEKTLEIWQVNDIYNRLLNNNIVSYKDRKNHVQNIHKNIRETNIKISNDICPRCGAKLVSRTGKRGNFKGCSSFPKCRFTSDI